MNELSKETRALLDELGRDDEPSEADVERNLARVRAALLVGGAAAATTTGTTSTASAAAPGAAAGSLGAKIAVSVLIVGGVIAAAVVLVPRGEGVARAPRPTIEAPSPEAIPAETPPARDDDTPPVIAEVPASDEPAPLRRASRRAPPPSSVEAEAEAAVATDVAPVEVPPTTTADRAAELAQLIRAQRLLGAGDASGALALFDDALAAHPSGALREEAEAGRVLSLCALHRADAPAARDAFLGAHPRSPSAARITRECH